MRFDDCVCSTSTTGTGTLTLAATPVPPGGADFDVWARAAGFGNSAAVLVDYTIIEYTSSTFGTTLQQESGIGTLTLGASSGIANCTLARTEIDNKLTSLNSQPASANYNPGTGISIGTAANTLVFCAARVSTVLPALPYGADSTTVGRAGYGIVTAPGGQQTSTFTVTNNQIIYLPIPVRVKNPAGYTKARVRIGNGTYTGQNNNVYAGLYDSTNLGLPGKLLADFGHLGTLNSAFGTSFAFIASAALGTPVYLEPGLYFLALNAIWTAGGTGTPFYIGATSPGGGWIDIAQMIGSDTNAGQALWLTVTSSTPAFSDPAITPTGLQGVTIVPIAYLGN